MLGFIVSHQIINPETHKVEDATTAARSLLTLDGIRFMFTSICERLIA
jgi:aminobenzoyl-glutamate transport protein